MDEGEEILVMALDELEFEVEEVLTEIDVVVEEVELVELASVEDEELGDSVDVAENVEDAAAEELLEDEVDFDDECTVVLMVNLEVEVLLRLAGDLGVDMGPPTGSSESVSVSDVAAATR